MRYNWVITQNTAAVVTNHCFCYKQAGYVHLTIKASCVIGVISTDCPRTGKYIRINAVISDIRYITVQNSLMYGFTE